MAKDKYLSIKSFVNGFSFANLGLFTGFAGGAVGSVYSLVLLDIFKNSGAIGIYISIYSLFCMFVSLFANEIFKYISKAKIFYSALLALSIGHFLLGFSIKPETFISIDYICGIAGVFIGILIPLFMVDFSKDVGIARLNARYYLWINVGALIAPGVSMLIASYFDNKSVFFATSFVYLVCLFVFKFFGIIQEDKKVKKINTKSTIKSLIKNVVSFFYHPTLVSSYFINFGYYALYTIRNLYVPISVIENGFSKGTLGVILTIGILPYILISEFVGKIARKKGIKLPMFIGFVSFGIFAFLASIVKGWSLLIIFVLWRFSGAIMEPVHDLFFFESVKSNAKAKYYGIFKTARNLTSFIIPVLTSVFIFVLGGTQGVWIAATIISFISALIVLYRSNVKR